MKEKTQYMFQMVVSSIRSPEKSFQDGKCASIVSYFGLVENKISCRILKVQKSS